MNDLKPRGLLHDADDVKTALLFAVDLAEEPKIGPNIGKAVFGGFVRSEGQDEILDAVAVDVLNRHLLSRGAILVEIDIRVRIGHAEDEALLFDLGNVEILVPEDDDVNRSLLGEGQAVGQNLHVERLHVAEFVFQQRNRRVVGNEAWTTGASEG